MPKSTEMCVEEFFPTSQATHMDTVVARARQMFQLPKAESDALRRSMVWMKKYIAPTSEFWDWPPINQSIDHSSSLVIRFIGIGWIVGIKRTCESQKSLPDHERACIHILNELTKALPNKSAARLRSSEWTPTERRNMVRQLRKDQLFPILRASSVLGFKGTESSVALRTPEEIILPCVDRSEEEKLRPALKAIKSWSNRGGRLEGADWCAFERRRLSKLIITSDSIQQDPRATPFAFGNTAGFPYKASNDRDEVEWVANHQQSNWALQFPHLPYHQGVIHPRCAIHLDTTEHDPYWEVFDYVSYLWANHYTRIKAYLEYEDQFVYASNMRRVRELDDNSVFSFGRKSLAMEELRNRVDFLNRVDSGGVTSYRPPHSRFRITAPTGRSCIHMLRNELIPHSTTNKLLMDPLSAAKDVLREATSEIARSHEVYSSVASLKMQRTMQVLQLLFVVAAVAQVLSWVDIARPLDSWVSRTPLALSLLDLFPTLGTFLSTSSFDFSLIVTQLALIGFLSSVTLIAVRIARANAAKRNEDDI